LPEFTDYSMKNRTYRYFHGKVLYAFGYGLSYSRFSYGKPELNMKQAKAGASVIVSTTVHNTSARAGDEVAELYIKPPQNGVSPAVELEGFKRFHLGAGEERRVQFTLSPRQLSEVDEKGNRAVVPGDYGIYISGAQPAAETPAATLNISGTMALPK
jgi:beta-glucosidase